MEIFARIWLGGETKFLFAWGGTVLARKRNFGILLGGGPEIFPLKNLILGCFWLLLKNNELCDRTMSYVVIDPFTHCILKHSLNYHLIKEQYWQF